MIGSSDWRGTPMTGKGRDKEESGAERGEARGDERRQKVFPDRWKAKVEAGRQVAPGVRR